MTLEEIEKAMKQITSGQELMEWMRPMLCGWMVALIRTGKGFVRFQLQSAPPESEDTGEIKCITAPNWRAAIYQAFQFAERNPVKP